MTEERRFKEEEIRAIFRVATESPDSAESPERTKSSIPTGGDLTLRDLQEIGMEVGIRPEQITAAALTLDKRHEVAPRRTYLGLPIAVGRTVDLPRAPTDREWAILVSELRETFSASGKVVSHGDLREWHNGNLHALVEPTETGYRLRLGTRKTTAVPTVTPAILLALGGTAVGYGALQQPAWAREREQQMEHIVARARTLIEPGLDRLNEPNA